jgi:hypothetical protein
LLFLVHFYDARDVNKPTEGQQPGIINRSGLLTYSINLPVIKMMNFTNENQSKLSGRRGNCANKCNFSSAE